MDGTHYLVWEVDTKIGKVLIHLPEGEEYKDKGDLIRVDQVYDNEGKVEVLQIHFK